MEPILQASLPVAPWMAAHTLRLPGTVPIGLDDWLLRDDAFAAQMALRDRLIAERRAEVHAAEPGAEAGAEELLGVLLARLAAAPGYGRDGAAVVRPDGVAVPLAGPPLLVAGRLVQEDLLLLAKAPGAAEHRLVAGCLCFPSNWTLAEKMGSGLARIHRPVADYDAGMAARVQRMLDHLRPERPLMRANLLVHGEPSLWMPRSERDRRRPAPGGARFVRVERQVLLRLPRTGAVVFSIHTFVVRAGALDAAQRAGLAAVRPEAFAPAR